MAHGSWSCLLNPIPRNPKHGWPSWWGVCGRAYLIGRPWSKDLPMVYLLHLDLRANMAIRVPSAHELISIAGSSYTSKVNMNLNCTVEMWVEEEEGVDVMNKSIHLKTDGICHDWRAGRWLHIESALVRIYGDIRKSHCYKKTIVEWVACTIVRVEKILWCHHPTKAIWRRRLWL